MARLLGSACRYCRREGIKLNLKGARCETAKCAMEKQGRNQAPGMHGWRRGRQSEYGIHLREKQKVKRYYGVLEKQFRIYFSMAERMKGNSGENLLQILERRLDNVVYKLNIVESRRMARHLIAHGHFVVNGRKTDVASFLVKPGDKITLRTKDNTAKLVRAHLEADPNAPIQGWLAFDASKLEGQVVGMPSREDVQIPVEENLIVEICSK